MRPVELVVRYFEGVPLPNQVQEWAGVRLEDLGTDGTDWETQIDEYIRANLKDRDIWKEP
jgi:hypothetical protein